MRYLAERGLRLGGVLLCVGCVQCGWGQEESARSGLESRPAVQAKTAPSAKTQASPFGQARAGGGSGTGSVVKSLLPASPQEESSPDGRGPGSRPVTRPGASTATPSKSAVPSAELQKMGTDPEGRDTQEIEASAERRRKIAEDFEEQRRFEREQALDQELALGDGDQDFEAPDAALVGENKGIGPEAGEAFAAEELDDAAIFLDPDLIEMGIDAAGRDVEEVEALADLRQEIAEDIAQEQRLEEEQVLDNEFALGDYDQDSGEDPRTRVQETSPQAGLEPVGSGAGAVVQGGDGDG